MTSGLDTGNNFHFIILQESFDIYLIREVLTTPALFTPNPYILIRNV